MAADEQCGNARGTRRFASAQREEEKKSYCRTPYQVAALTAAMAGLHAEAENTFLTLYPR